MNKSILSIILVLIFFVSCGKVKEKAKNTINKTGEVAGKAAGELASGITKGVEDTYQLNIELSDDLKQSGISLGKIKMESSDSASDNNLVVYIIANKNFEQEVCIKIFDDDNLEMGRLKKKLNIEKDDARFFTFAFSKHTNIDYNSKITME